MKKIKYIISAITVILFSGCFGDSPAPSLYTENEESHIEMISNIAETKTSDSKDRTTNIEAEMLKNDALYASEKPKKAIIQNKASDEIRAKPLFLEPLFAKVEIMAYQTENGLYHEQQSIWLKVKEGEIVIKSNDLGADIKNDDLGILNKEGK